MGGHEQARDQAIAKLRADVESLRPYLESALRFEATPEAALRRIQGDRPAVINGLLISGKQVA